MKILFVAMANSIHTARWINQLSDLGWEIHLYPVEDWGIHPSLKNLTVHNFLHRKPYGLDKSVRVIGSWPFPYGAVFIRRILKKFLPNWFDNYLQLGSVIRRLKPDIVHSLEMQHAGYLTLEARKCYKGQFPIWVMSIWGSDIYLFSRLQRHIDKIKDVLSTCDYFGCECIRDEKLARNLGFKGESISRLPMWGGLDFKKIGQFRQPGPVSNRRIIVLKGYQGWAGRALVGLRAIELCAEALKDYKVVVYLAGDDVRTSAELISHSTGISIEIIPYSPHEEMLRLQGKARISIGLSISDGLPSSMIEAMVMGSFPIQSCTACADEWIQDGITGLIVPPEDPEPIAAAIRRALSDDGMVDNAAELNLKIAYERLDYREIQKQVINIYEKLTLNSITV